MLEQKIVEAFLTASDNEKAIMLGNMPARIAQQPIIYEHLGSSQAVWKAYLNQVGPKGIQALSPADLVAHFQPIMQADQTLETINAFLMAKVMVPETLEILMFRIPTIGQGLSRFDLIDLSNSLRQLREQALPAILKMLALENPFEQQFAFHAFTIEEWREETALQTLTEAIIKALYATTYNFIMEHCVKILAVTDPDALLRYVVEVIRAYGENSDEPRLKMLQQFPEPIQTAFEATPSLELKQTFALESFRNDVSWYSVRVWDMLVTIAPLGQSTFKKVFSSTSTRQRGSIGGALRYNRSHNPQEWLSVAKVIKPTITELLAENYPTENLQDFLVQAQSFFTDTEYVDIMVKVHENGGETADLAQYCYYERSTPEEVMWFMHRLGGTAKLFAAMMILRLVKKSRYGFDHHQAAFRSALQTLTEAFSTTGTSVPRDSIEVVQKVPLVHLRPFLGEILEKSTPRIAAEFAIFVLEKVDENDPTACATIARLMTIEKEDVQWLLRRHLSSEIN